MWFRRGVSSLFRMPFYAVAKGREPGVYLTWPECELNVKGFNGAKYKKFSTRSEAENFINGSEKRPLDEGSSLDAPNKRLRAPATPIVGLKQHGKFMFHEDAEGFVHVYTDGSCESNGQAGACAGLGVYFGEGHALNTSEPVKGRPTNNCGEIQAATLAIRLAREQGIPRLQINTDSKYLVNAMTAWLADWKRRGWKSARGGELKNLDDFTELDKELEQKDIELRWMHVEAHKGLLGNERADRLAREGAQKFRERNNL